MFSKKCRVQYYEEKWSTSHMKLCCQASLLNHDFIGALEHWSITPLLKCSNIEHIQHNLDEFWESFDELTQICTI